MPPSRPRSPDQMLRGHPGLLRPPTSVQPASPQCPGEKGQVAPAEAPVILSSPRTSKTDSYELVWRPRHEGGSRAPILYYEVKHRKVRCLALCLPPLRLGGGLCYLPPLELPLQPGLPTPLLVTTSLPSPPGDCPTPSRKRVMLGIWDPMRPRKKPRLCLRIWASCTGFPEATTISF